MHVALNGYFWSRPDTGSGQYLRQLVYHLNRLVSDLTITLVVPGVVAPEQVPPSVKVMSVATRPGHLGKVWFEQIGFPRACRQAGADLCHVPYWGPPLRSPVPLVVTIHDLITLIVPDYRRGLRPRLYNALISAAARGANHIITDSLFSKADITGRLAIPEARVTAIYLAAGRQFNPQSQFLLDMAVQRKYELPDFFVLYLGGYETHKNVTTLLLAYSYVAQALGEDYPLLLSGRRPTPGPHFPNYDDYIQQLNLGRHVRWLGYIDEEDKPALYRAASAFVFPSRYEGFGLPVLEAMSCGIPVVTTEAASLPEVVGQSAFAVPPDDEREMAGAIIATLIQDNLAAELKQKGLDQAAKFSWESTATQTLLVYDQASKMG